MMTYIDSLFKEGRDPDKELVEARADGPPIKRRVVPLPGDNLMTASLGLPEF